MVVRPKGEDFQQALTEYLEAVTQQEVEIISLTPLAGGASRDMWQVRAKVNGEGQEFVLRRDQGTVVSDRTLERDQEFKVMKVVHEAGVNVARPRWYCLEPLILGQPFLILDYIEGLTIGQQVIEQPELAEARKTLPEAMGVQLARIHAIDVGKHDLDFLPHPREGFSPAQEALAQIRELIQQMRIYNPVLEFGWRWLQQHLPKSDKTALLHGDFRVGNVLVGSQGLKGIIDWEYARIGDPLDDLAWACLRDWRYGNTKLLLGGIEESEPFIKAYEKESGHKIDRKALAFWEILGNLRWAVGSIAQANRHLRGGSPSLELASLGRRSAEMQLEMLTLIGSQGLDGHVR
jgi:aminoglycoside phosphotransferase (APT) family kinase protein